MRESTIEKYLNEKVKATGGRSYKWVSPGLRGVPDRIVVLPGGTIFFVELKAPGKEPEPLQKKRIKELQDLGCDVWSIDSKNDVDAFIHIAKQIAGLSK